MPRSAPLPRRLRRRSTALLFAASLAALSACGNSDDGASSGTSPSAASSSAAEDGGPSSADSQSITATEADFSITLDSTDLKAGDYEIKVVNDGGATHDLAVERDGQDIAKSDTIAPGSTGSLTVSLEPGEYVFFCSIGNHRAMGMEVKVTVT